MLPACRSVMLKLAAHHKNLTRPDLKHQIKGEALNFLLHCPLFFCLCDTVSGDGMTCAMKSSSMLLNGFNAMKVMETVGTTCRVYSVHRTDPCYMLVL
jgi:hypothetical protein